MLRDLGIMSKLNKVTEIIPDDIPRWASDAINNGDFFKVCIEKVTFLEREVNNLKNNLTSNQGHNCCNRSNEGEKDEL